MLYGFNKDKEKIPLYNEQEVFDKFLDKNWNMHTQGDKQDSDSTYKLGTDKYGKVIGVWMDITKAVDRMVSYQGIIFLQLPRAMTRKTVMHIGDTERSVTITSNRLIPICVMINGQIVRMVNEPSGATNYLYISNDEFYVAVPGFTPSTQSVAQYVDSIKVYCLVDQGNGVEQSGFDPVIEKYQSVNDFSSPQDVIIQRTPYNKEVKINGSIGQDYEMLECSLAVGEEYVDGVNNLLITRTDEITLSFAKYVSSGTFPLISGCALSYLYNNSAAINT